MTLCLALTALVRPPVETETLRRLGRPGGRQPENKKHSRERENFSFILTMATNMRGGGRVE